MTIFPMILCYSFVVGTSVAELQTIDDLDALRRLVVAERAAYPRLRHELLSKNGGPWNVALASGESWELGVAAFVLNSRRASPGDFATMDAEKPGHYANLQNYRFRGVPLVHQLAFLLEKIWRPLDAEDRARAVNDLGLRLSSGSTAIGESQLWLSIWEQCPIERLRQFSVLFLAASNDPGVLDAIGEVLRTHDEPSIWQTQAYCLMGLWTNELPEAAELVLAEWDRLKRDRGLAEKALGALAASPSPKAREAVYAFAMKPENPEWLRHESVVGCSLRRHPGDREFVERFLTEVDSVKLKRKVLADLGALPLADVRPALLGVLRESSDSEMASAAALALTQGYIKAKEINPSEIAADIALLEAVAERASLPENTRALIRSHRSAIKDRRDRDR